MSDDPAVARELAGLEMAVAMATAAFDEAVDIRGNLATMPLDSADKSTLRPAIALCNVQLGAARGVLTAMRLRLIARLHAPRLGGASVPAVDKTPPALEDGRSKR